MAIKYREVEELRLTTKKELTLSPENWKRFLRTASNTYKYGFEDQILISAQFPNAKAVAPFSLWSERFGRQIKEGEKGIGLIDNTGRYPKMRYVFDISQSLRSRNIPDPYIWDIDPGIYDDVVIAISGDTSLTIEEAIVEYCENAVDSSIGQYENDILAEIRSNRMFKGIDENDVIEDFRQAVYESVKYTALIRCGSDTTLVNEDIFSHLSIFSSKRMTNILGSSVSRISSTALSGIEATVKDIVERRNQYEHNIEEQSDQRDTTSSVREEYDVLSDSKAGRGDRFDLYSRSRNIRVHSRSDGNGGREGHRDLGRETKQVSQGKQEYSVLGDVRRTHADGSSDRGERSSGANDGRSDRENDGAGRRDGEAEGGRLDGVGAQSKLDTTQSRGNSQGKSDLRLKYQVITYAADTGTDERTEYVTLREAKQAGNAFLKNGDEGFAVFDKSANKAVYIKGNFPDNAFSDEVNRNSSQAYLEYYRQKKKRRITKKTEERQISPVFSSADPKGEQLSLFAEEQTEQDRINEYAMSRLISAGTGFEDGKFRIIDFFREEHTREEKAKFLSNEYGWGGSYYDAEEFETRPGKGITMKHTDKEKPENNITVHLTYKEAADMIDVLIRDDRFITPKDIENRKQRALYFLKNYDADNLLESSRIEQAKAILDSYGIDYSQYLKNNPVVETATPEEVEEMKTSIPEDAEIPSINAADSPDNENKPIESVNIESAIVADFRSRTTESFHLIGEAELDEFDIELEVEGMLRDEMRDSNIAGEINGVVLYGSRSRGLESSEDADIDIVVQINGAELKEDALYNIFKAMDIEIDGIPVDVNPIRPEETGTLDEYLPKAEAYLEQKQAERAEQVLSSVGEQQNSAFNINEYDDPDYYEQQQIADEEAYTENIKMGLEAPKDKSKTLVVNIYGGPGAGKSTTALQLVAELKKQGLTAEYVSEYAKELVYAKDFEHLDGTLQHQSEIYEEQRSRIDLLIENVNVVVTDSPLPLNAIYLNEDAPDYIDSVIEEYNTYQNFNIYLTRDMSVEFEQEGRIHNLEQSLEKDDEIRELLDERKLPYSTFDRTHIRNMVYSVMNELTEQQIVSFPVGEQEEDDPYLITDPVITIDKYNYTLDFNRIGEIRFTRETETNIGGLDNDGHEKRDNFGVSEEYTSFSFSDDGYITRYITDNGADLVTSEQLVEDIEELIHKSLTTPDMSIRITDREGNISYLDRGHFTIIEEAKKRINDFVVAEYDSEGADFSDLSNIGVAYTTTEDGLHEIQATVDLVNTSIIKRVDGGVISLTKYETLADLVDALNDLDFTDLTYLTDEQLQQVNERGNSEDDLKITSVAVNIEPDVPENYVSAEIGFSESPIIDDVNERIANSTEPLSFAAVNAVFEYLDEKQHLERLDPLLKAGWYNKTDFTITAVVDGEEFSYEGRFDIGDGKGTGGGSLTDHISDFINYTLARTNPYHLSDDELAEQQKVKDIVIPFLREHEELTPADERFINRIKAQYPLRMTEEKIKSLIGKDIDYNGRQYVVDGVDIAKNKAHIRDDKTGWYPLFQDVELRDIVGQNIDLILDEKEQFFRDCDLPALLAKSSLAWDEIESLGYIFYEKGYIDRVRPTDAAHYGNGFFAQTEAFELARRYQNGEDVSRELAEKLFLYKNKNAPLTSIPFEDSYVEDLELQIEQTNTGLFVSYGAYSREVSFEEIGRAYLNYFSVENEAIRKEAAEEEAELSAKKEKTFSEQVDEALAPGNDNQFNALKVCDTPDILLSVGCKQLPMLYAQKHLREAIKPKNKHTHAHGLSIEQIKKLPELLESPVMIFDSPARNDSIVVCVSAIDQDNLPIIVSIKPNGTGTYELEKVDSNFITSVYGRNNFEDYIEKIVNEDKMLFWDKEKSQELFRVSGLQSPKCLNSLNSDIIIHQSRNIVNDISEEKINLSKETTDRTKEESQEGNTEEKSQAPSERLGEQYSELTDGLDLTSTLQQNNSEVNTENLDNTTPQQNKGSVSLRKVGDFYEMYGKDAEIGAEVLGLRILSKNVSPMVGFPDHIKDEYSAKLREAGYTVLIEQVFELNQSDREPDKLDNATPDPQRIEEIKSILDGALLEYDGHLYEYIGKEKNKLIFQDISSDYHFTVDYDNLIHNKNYYAQQGSENYHIQDLMLGQKKPLDKLADNLAAIRTLKHIEAENREATPKEQVILSKYTGWGGLSKVFEPENKHYQEVRELLTDDEYAAARKSTLTAFYTSPVIIKEMYAKLADMGFNGGKLLEPSCGIGNFIGMIPGSNTKVTGIELDSLTGRIAQKLYPQADIQVCGFENSKLKENSFDVAVGNVPFGDFSVFDKQYNKDNLLIHDYFFSKSLEMVKPGGVVAFITSKGTLDKLDETARRKLAEKAEFLGAVRLPNNAFKANAGTEVTSDIIFLQKRTEPVVIESEKEPLWIKTSKDANGIEMNAYFATHPEQICGTMTMVSGQFGMESTCEPNRDTKLSEQIRAAMSNIQGTIEAEKAVLNEEMGLEAPISAPESLRNSSYFISDGKAYFYESGESTPVNFAKSKAKKSLEKMSEMVAIRDTVRQLLEMQLDESVSDEEIKAVQATLSALYDKFAEKHGRIKDKENADVMKGDSSLPLLKSLEKYSENGEYEGKADIFSKRTIKAEHIVTEVGTSVDALAVSLSSELTKGKVDLDYMSQLTGFDKDKIINDLKGAIFKIPDSDEYVPADEYLSGNILTKLEKAQRAFDEGDISLGINIEALENAMPERLTATDIDVRLGSTWINPEYIRDFVYELLDTPRWNRNQYSPNSLIDVQYSQLTGAWSITNKALDKENVKGRTLYGTRDRSAYELIEDCLNLKATTIKIKIEENGKERYVVEPTRTAQARAKQEVLMQKFKEWIFADKTRRDDLVDTYNRIYNSSRPREYDGSHLNFVGMNPEINLRKHQLDAVARCLYGGNALLAHEVGAGKTYEMIAAAMEGKRLGLHNKSLMVVPNHLTEQIGADFIKLYPNANVLVATKKDFEKENRKALMAKIATGNYDAIIIGHSQLEKIPLSRERQVDYIQYQINETLANIAELKAMNGERFQIKQAESTAEKLRVKLEKLLDSPKDDTVTFEELGVDKLFLDEAHLFKNLFLSTKMQNVSGVSTSSDVQKTADLFMKTRYLDEITGGKGIVFATGTPVSNTMCEIYNMQRYLQMDLLKEKHLEHFDCWASTFGENVTQMELAPEGKGYRAKTRFSKFFNLPELMQLFKEVADIQTAETLNLPGIPECEVHNVAVEPTETQKALVDTLSKRAEAIHNRQVDPSTDNMLKLTTDGRKIGLDQRLINPDLPDEPGTKVNVCVDNVFRIWENTAEEKGTQLIFCDFSTPKNDGSFNLYDDIKDKLVEKGVPEEQIAFIHDATNEVKREELFGKVRSGEVRVLIGSTSKMGAGTNVQERLVASHDLDAPYRPADMEQRRGRMVRQGNKNSKVDLYRYCTKDTFDAYLFQMLERKQSFISQIMTSKSPQRRCDDVDEATLSYAEVKALCVGDPRIKEKMELDNDIGKLRLERSSYQQEQYRLEDMKADLEKNIAVLKDNIPKNQNDYFYVSDHPLKQDEDGKKIFDGMILNDKPYPVRRKAQEAFMDACRMAVQKGAGKDYVAIGEYRGFKVSVKFNSYIQEYTAQLEREGTYHFNVGTDNIVRMDNIIENLEDTCKERIERLSQREKELSEVTDQIGKPFPKEEEYQTKTARLAILNVELDVDGKKNEQGGITQENDTKSMSNGMGSR